MQEVRNLPEVATTSAGEASILGDPLLTTKLYIPSVRPDLVTRRRLTAKVNEGVGGMLTLISAPAGFGKTTLLGEWALQSDLPISWVSLDESDNDTGRFLTYITAAIGDLHDAFGSARILGPLHSSRPPHLESVLTALVNEVVGIQRDFALVLDDYHAIQSPTVHEALAFLLEHAPPQMHVIVASRTEPPLSLARLLSQGQLTKLSAVHLRFSSEEVVAFLNEAMGIELTPDDVAALEERTEGWIAGLQLAALSMRGRRDPGGFIQSFTGSNRYVLDYLAEEVLRKQAGGVQEFLLETSVLGRLCGPLCDGVTGRDDGQAMLEKLERENLFVVPLDEDRRWFRYHHLFSQFLEKELRRNTPERVPDLHRRACDWFEREGLVAEAVSHALAADDPERAANLVERVARTTLRRGELSTLRRWLEELSEDLVCARPRLCLFYAWYYLAAGRLDDVEPYLIRAEDAVDGARKPERDAGRVAIRGEATTIRAVIAGLRGNPTLAMDLSREAAEMLTEDNQFLRCMIAASRGFARRGQGDVAGASEEFAEAAALARSVKATYVALLAYKQLAELRMAQGRLRAAADVCRRALDLVSESGARLPASSAAHVGMGELLREWNELQAAEGHLREAIALGERGGNAEIVLDGLLALARTRSALGDRTGAWDELEAARKLSERHDMDAWTDRVRAWQARFAAAQGDRWAAERWLEECGLSTQDPDYRSEFEYVTLARVLMALGQHDEAWTVLERLLRWEKSRERGGRVVEIITLQALNLSARGRRSEAVDVLRTALALAEPEGYVRTFTDEGPPMLALLEQARRVRRPSHREAGGDASPQYVAGLLAALGGDPSIADSSSGAVGHLADLMSEREIEVLRHLASGTANREIAERLFVSLDTVKTHLKHIYSKLGVHSRTQAVAQAREFGLIQDAPARRASDR